MLLREGLVQMIAIYYLCIRMSFFSFSSKSPFYVSRIVLGCTIVWSSLYFLSDDKKLFALISVIVVTEPDVVLLLAAVRSRVINTLTGCSLGLLFIYISPSFWSMLIAISISVIISTSYKQYPASWKLAPVTVVLVMISAISEDISWKAAMGIALSRTGEILYGSLVAVLLGVGTNYIRKRLGLKPYEAEDLSR